MISIPFPNVGRHVGDLNMTQVFRLKNYQLISVTTFMLCLLILSSCSPENLVVKFKDSGSISGTVLPLKADAQSAAQTKAQAIGQAGSQTINQSQISDSQVRPLSCSAASAHLYYLNTSGVKVEPALAEAAIDENGRYQFKLDKKLTLEKSLFVEVTGCSEPLSRVLTGKSQQDVSYGTTLVSWVSQGPQSSRVVDGDKEQLKRLLSLLETTDSFSAAYAFLNSNPTAKAAFESVFGVTPLSLTEVPPQQITEVAPVQAHEGTPVNFSISTHHWLPTYHEAYLWKLDSTQIGTSRNISFTPSANSQGDHTLTVYYGMADAQGNLDLIKPFKSKTFLLSIIDDQPAEPPVMTLVGSNIISSPTLTLRFNTGANKINCQTFSKMAITEDSLFAPLTEPEYNITCSQANSQDYSFTLSGGQGVHSLRLWVRDAAGFISQNSSQINVNYDTTAPVIAVSSPTLNSRVQGTVSISGTCEAGVPVTVSGAVLTSVQTSCAVGIFSTSITLSNGEGAKSLTLTQTDVAGNLGTLNYGLVRDDTPPAPVITGPAAQSTTQNNLTLTGTCSTNTGDLQTVTVSGVDIASSPLTTSCVTGNFSQALALTGSDGVKAISVAQADSSGNIGTVTQNFSKDTTAPSLSFTSPLALQVTQGALVLTGTCEAGSVQLSGDFVGSPASASCVGSSFFILCELIGCRRK